MRLWVLLLQLPWLQNVAIRLCIGLSYKGSLQARSFEETPSYFPAS